MKKKVKQQTKRGDLTRAVPIVLVLFLLLGIFVACGGLPASDEDKTTEKQYFVGDSLEFPTIKNPDTIPEYDADIVEPEYTTRYAASSESDKYHLPSCHYVDQILSYNLIYFYSEDSARRAGYSPCSVCNP